MNVPSFLSDVPAPDVRDAGGDSGGLHDAQASY